MMKLSFVTSTLFFGLATALLPVASACAQRGRPVAPAARLPAPVPAAARQPLIDSGRITAEPAAADMAAAAIAAAARPEADPATCGVKTSGRDLKKAIARVDALQWHKRLAAAEAEAAATGKPILLLQTLGELTGFA